MEIDFLKRCLQRIEEQRMLQALTGKRLCTRGPARNERQRVGDSAYVRVGGSKPKRVLPFRSRGEGCRTPDNNQLWIADITFIRLETEFVYLVVVLDAFSRRVIGWALDRTLEAKLTVAALEMALSCRSVEAGLVHHSDRGVQCAADDYKRLLAQHGI